jgi:hypothetical protein
MATAHRLRTDAVRRIGALTAAAAGAAYSLDRRLTG